jgi:hypothetical protein
VELLGVSRSSILPSIRTFLGITIPVDIVLKAVEYIWPQHFESIE